MQRGASQPRQMQQALGCSASRQLGTFWPGLPPAVGSLTSHTMTCPVVFHSAARWQWTPALGPEVQQARASSVWALGRAAESAKTTLCDLPPDHGAEEGVQPMAEDSKKSHTWSSKLSSRSFPNRASPPLRRATRLILTLRFAVPFGHSDLLPTQRGGYGAAQEKTLLLLHFSKNQAQHITQMLGLKKYLIPRSLWKHPPVFMEHRSMTRLDKDLNHKPKRQLSYPIQTNIMPS